MYSTRLISTFLLTPSGVRSLPLASSCSSWAVRSLVATNLRRNLSSSRPAHASNESLPRIASPSIWHSIVPKAFRQPSDPVSLAERARLRSEKPKGWNPATFFIIISLLIGSNAIQTIALRNEFLNFSRKADAKIALLKEVIERVQKGEDVDVEGLLGTGNKEKEKEWEEGKSCALRWLFALNVILLFEWLANVLREIEAADMLWQSQQRKKEKAKEREGGLSEQGEKHRIDARQEEASKPDDKSLPETDRAVGRPAFY
ncbi:hypothetical protein LTR16_000537 [Cryomyces antarcticus]|uniref:Sensitive to high expression protein 9, mitochondrial n=1 Tax=Cryomyces antarcticus TaxID=329879 RepID=A0ABR0M981_9PEZI|nr:hypothetical protein LTR60_004999 [Cryomyces antarcticus]KAK5018228.1 hypothetical protein LTR39_001102 [Cryomyces antarcticus]KAK5296624.1 hypothetical protein LTR16_000537 [Cryomyces antarcticus]